MKFSWSNAGGGGSGYADILLDVAAARTHGPDDRSGAVYRDPTAEDDDPGAVGRIDPEPLPAALGELCKIIGRHVEGPRGPRFIDSDSHTPQPRAIHPHVCNQSATGIGHRYVVRDADF